MPEAAYVPSTSPEVAREKTGKTWDQWFRILDRWKAPEKGHKATARYLQDEHGVPGWWAQNVTVEYERSRGLREVGQRVTGEYETSVSRTVPVDLEAAIACWTDGRKRRRWLTDDLLAPAVTSGMRQRKRSDTKVATMLRLPLRIGDRSYRLAVSFEDKGGKTQVVAVHQGLGDKATRDAFKARWGPVMDAFKRLAVETD